MKNTIDKIIIIYRYIEQFKKELNASILKVREFDDNRKIARNLSESIRLFANINDLLKGAIDEIKKSKSFEKYREENFF